MLETSEINLKQAAKLTGIMVRTMRRTRDEYGVDNNTITAATAMALAVLAGDGGFSTAETAKRLHDVAYGLEMSEKDTFDA